VLVCREGPIYLGELARQVAGGTGRGEGGQALVLTVCAPGWVGAGACVRCVCVVCAVRWVGARRSSKQQ
jgi:hypothetical protein